MQTRMHRGVTVVMAVVADPDWGAFSCQALGLAFTYISSLLTNTVFVY